MARMCPRCGRENVQFVGALCAECYVETHRICDAPERLDFVYCSSCGSYKAQGAWLEGRESLDETLREYVLLLVSSKIKPSPGVDEVWLSSITLPQHIPPSGLVEVELEVEGRAGGVSLRERRLVKVKIDSVLCPMCLKRKTKSGYRGVVQVRTLTGEFSSTIESALGKILGELGSRVAASIIAVESHKHGVDILVADHTTARLIAGKIQSALGGFSRESYKMGGVDSRGRRVSILSISVRVPDISSGDRIAVGGRVYKVLSLTPEKAIVEEEDSGEVAEIEFSRLAGARKLR